MTHPMQLTLEPVRVDGPTLEVAAVLSHPEGKRYRLWWRIPAEWREALTSSADAFVIAFLFLMMQERRDVMVEGVVSPSLLANLDQYMGLWRMWLPEKYQPVTIRAREEAEAPAPEPSGQTIMPFSCGIDSCYTLLRHRQGSIGRRARQVTAAMVLHGFDIWLDQENAQGMYDGLLGDARTMLNSVDVACIPVVNNFHDLPVTWAHSFGTHLLAALRLLGGRFDTAMLANDVPYNRLGIIWGNHPIGSPFLCSTNFQVVDDGAEITRAEKIKLLTQWPEAMRHLRVCFTNPGSHANCCRCEKCVRTILAFRVAGVPLPAAFAAGLSNRQIRRTRFHNEWNVRQWLEAITGAERRGLGQTGWVRAARTAIRRNRRRWKWRRLRKAFLPLRNRLRKLFRGSPLSRRELRAHAKSAQQAE